MTLNFDLIAGHLPALQMIVTMEGPLYQAGCSCGWLDAVMQDLAATAGREYDLHINLILNP